MTVRRGPTVTLVVVTCLAGCGRGRAVRTVPLPPRDTGPVTTVRAYIDALDGHDARTARALSSSGRNGDTDAWLKTTDRLSMLSVSPPRPEAGDAGPGRFPRLLSVTVRLDRGRSSDPSMPARVMGWNYIVRKGAATDRWLVVGQGTG